MADGRREAHDSAVSFADHLPAPALRPFVAAAHGYRVPAMPAGVHRGLPSRHLTLATLGPSPLGHVRAGSLLQTGATSR
jgi:hypothetical protein